MTIRFQIKDNAGDLVATATLLEGVGTSCPIQEGTVERRQIDGACRFLAAEHAAVSANLECGWTVFKIVRTS